MPHIIMMICIIHMYYTFIPYIHISVTYTVLKRHANVKAVADFSTRVVSTNAVLINIILNTTAMQIEVE